MSNRIISYRGLLTDGGQNTINLHTNNGKTGYKITKFELMPARPGSSGSDFESVVKIYKVPQTTVAGNIDFNDQTLIAAGTVGGSASLTIYNSTPIIVFDNEIFNQDIYITHTEKNGTEDINYYIELEQVNLSEDQALVAIVKNLRNEQ